MRKLLRLLLSLLIIFSLIGCESEDTQTESPYLFYYLRADILYGAEDSVISSEYCEWENTDADTLLEQYFLGPHSEHLVTPFPSGTKLLSVKKSDDSLLVYVNNTFEKLTELEYTLACACLARTCFSLYNITEITIRVEGSDNSITLNNKSLTLVDSEDTIRATIGTETPTS